MKLIKNKIEKQYNEEQMTQKELAKFYDISLSTITRFFKNNGIKSRGYLKNDKHRKKLSEARMGEKNPNFGKKCKSHGKRHWFKCPNRETVSMRSTWEIAYAEYLDSQNIKWEYEPKTFLLEGGDAYTPDFYLIETNTYVEVKGWLRETHKKKIEGFKVKYPKEKWILANKEYLTNLGINLRKIWITSKPKFNCIQCDKKFHRKYPDQRLCSVDCRNKFISGGGKLQKKNKPKRKYNGNQSGENNSSSKLTLEDVAEIKNMKKEGIPVIEIANTKKTSPSNIYNICRGVSWKD